MEQPPKVKPKLKEFVWENWADWKERKVPDIKKELADVCEMPSGNEMLSFMFAFNNKKKNEKTKLQKNRDLDESQTSNSASTKADLSNQIYVQQIDHLRKNICQNEKKKKQEYLQEQIDKNPFLIMKFMETRMINMPADFLEIMVQICYDLKENQQLQTKLFVRICAIHFDELLNINEGLLQLALKELSNVQEDLDAAYGFLKLAFQNHIAVVNFPIELLTTFQSRYNMVFGRFYNYLSGDIASQVIGCLPATCFLFTEPFYKVLKEGGDDLHEQIQPDYLPFLIDLLAYSFENDFEAFNNFLKLFKKGCMILSGRGINIIPLMNDIHQEEFEKKPKFFGSLKKTYQIFDHVFSMIEEGKLTSLDQKQITQLINSTDQELREQRLKPKQLKTNSENEQILKLYIQKFSKMNQSLSGYMVNFPYTQNESYSGILELFQISQMNQVQMISSYIMDNLFEEKKLFQQFETGIGKTTLSLIFMLNACQKHKKKCISIYKQEGLCYRDYKRLQGVTSGMPISILYLTKDDQIGSIQKSDIVFVSDSMYQTLCKNKDFENFLVESLTIIDEYDSILFDEKKPIDELLNYNKSNHLIGFTGSDLTNQHQKVLQELFDSTFLRFPLAQNIDGSINNCRESIAFAKRSEQLNHVSSICQEQCQFTPILLILDKAGRKQFKDTNNKKLPIVDLTQKNSVQIEAHLRNSFLLKKKDAFQVCLISKSQGRGIDVPTNSQVEQSGGVTVIIADAPVNQRELDQLKGRTKRMQYKGQHFVVLWNNLSMLNESFLGERMDIAAQQEDLYLNDLSLKLQKITEDKLFEEEKKDTNLNDRVNPEENTSIQNCQDKEKINDQIQSNFNELQIIDIEKRQQNASALTEKVITKEIENEGDHQGNLLNIKENFAQNNDQGQQLNPKEFKQTESFNKNEEDKILEQDPLNTLVKTPIQDPVVKLSIEVNKKLKKSSNNKPSKKIKTKKPLIKGKPTNKIQLKISEAQVDKQVGPIAAPNKEEPQTLDSPIQPKQFSLADLDKEGKKTAIRSKVPIEKDQDAPTPKRGNDKSFVQIGEMAVKQQKDLKQRDDGITSNLGKRKKVEPSKMEGKQEKKKNKKQKLQ